MLKHAVKDLEAYWIPTGKLTGDGQAEKFQVVEGKGRIPPSPTRAAAR